MRILHAPSTAEHNGSQASAAESDSLCVGVAQITPVWLDRDATVAKVARTTAAAANEGCQLVVFGEALIPGYPFWLDPTGGARFNNPEQKAMHAHYLQHGVSMEGADGGDLAPLCKVAREHRIAINVGVMERAADRGGHTLYCTLVYINERGEIGSTHRKLQPTYEERLAWGQGDGNGLRVHPLGAFTLGGLNCWENWMPMARAALYGMGEDLHVSVWPGGMHNTPISTFIAQESRSYVIASCGLLRAEDIPDSIPLRERIIDNSGEWLANGGSTIVAPNGQPLVEPVANEEVLIVATLDHARVREERQNFDAAGHYSRPDVLQLSVDRRRQSTVKITDN